MLGRWQYPPVVRILMKLYFFSHEKGSSMADDDENADGSQVKVDRVGKSIEAMPKAIENCWMVEEPLKRLMILSADEG